MNPFKFGTVVDEPFFINRKEELSRIDSLVKSENHIIIISPRRYGKTSLIRKFLKKCGRRYIFLDMQLVVSPEDFAAQLLKRVYRISTLNRLKGMIKSFRIVPGVTVNPITGDMDVSFRPSSGNMIPLEDVLNLVENLGTPTKKIIIALDEFQEIFRINKGMDRILRSIMQNHKNVNYIFSGSSESMIQRIFEHKKSPFYHFAYLLPLNTIPEDEFSRFLNVQFMKLSDRAPEISSAILKETSSHPYYTQQLAFVVWDLLTRSDHSDDITVKAVNEILQNHDNNYERLWHGFNRSDMKVLLGLSVSDLEPLSKEFSVRFDAGPDSTVYSSLQRLASKGIVVKPGKSYIIDDPFFRKWIILRRNA